MPSTTSGALGGSVFDMFCVSFEKLLASYAAHHKSTKFIHARLHRSYGIDVGEGLCLARKPGLLSVWARGCLERDRGAESMWARVCVLQGGGAQKRCVLARGCVLQGNGVQDRGDEGLCIAMINDVTS